MKNNTRGLILAAGRGSRMGAATENTHKCLTKLQGQTLLDWQLDSLRKVGIVNITVVRGYKAEMLVGDFSVAHNSRWAETNMVATLFCASEYQGDTIISYSDIVYSPNHVKALNELEADIAITADKEWLALWAERFENPFDDAETFKSTDNILTEIGEKTMDAKNIEAQYMGLLKFSAKGWQKAFNVYSKLAKERQDKLDMTSLLALLIKEETIKVVFVNGGWCEVDNYNDVLTYEKALSTKTKWHHDWR